MSQSKPAAGKGALPVPGNAVVLAAMTVVSIALGIGFSAHLGMPASAAITCAALIYVGFVISHLAVVRGRKVSELEDEIAKLWVALGQDGERLAQRSPTRDAKSKQAAPQASQAPHQAMPASPIARAMSRASEPDPVAAPLEPAKSGAEMKPVSDLRGLVRPQVQSIATAAAAAPAPASASAASKTSPEADPRSLADETAIARAMAEPESDFLDAPTVYAPAPAAAPASGPAPSENLSASQPPLAAAIAATNRPLDAAAIHEMVKKLATETAAAGRTTGVAQPPEPVASEQITEEPTVAAPSATAPAAIDGDAITESVRALRAAADAMKTEPELAQTSGEYAYDLDAIEPAYEVDGAAAETSAVSEDRLTLLADALSADRIDVMLEPILGLKDQATRHYEVSVSLRTADGVALDPNEDRSSLGGTGILPLIDLAKLARVAEVSRRLAERGKTGSVFAGFAGESLADDDFLNRFADVYQDRAGITEQLVVALAQEDVRVFAPAHWSMIKDLSGAGFRFALEHVTDLDMDFDQLKAANIQYVKLDAEVYLNGLPAGEGVTIPASDVYKLLADKGLSLIVDHIVTETQLMRVVDCGALYGQGRLFGGPRPVKAQVFTPRAA
jgi:cyclic-di-GMP phosphodiesterase TipF (flagellum assembly factor)